MSDSTFLLLSAIQWTALATVAMAVAAVASVVFSAKLKKSQDRVIGLQASMIELQRRANWLNGALESHSELMLRLKAEERGKKVVWWDPTYESSVKQPPPTKPVHGESAPLDKIYVYVPSVLRRHPDIS